MGTNAIYRGTFWVQTQKNDCTLEIAVSLEMSGFARPTFFERLQISLMLLQSIWDKIKISVFFTEICPCRN
ncbi:hypothetical protein AC806_10520 [Tetragenococcus halophilus]|nr:hypothetical protein AC806_10520 [Tetragenococcus halophilus]